MSPPQDDVVWCKGCERQMSGDEIEGVVYPGDLGSAYCLECALKLGDATISG